MLFVIFKELFWRKRWNTFHGSETYLEFVPQIIGSLYSDFRMQKRYYRYVIYLQI